MERRREDHRGHRQEGCRLGLGRLLGLLRRDLGRLLGWERRQGCRRGLGGELLLGNRCTVGWRGGGWEFRWDVWRAWMAFFCYGVVCIVYYPACLHRIYFAEMDLGRGR